MHVERFMTGQCLSSTSVGGVQHLHTNSLHLGPESMHRQDKIEDDRCENQRTRED